MLHLGCLKKFRLFEREELREEKDHRNRLPLSSRYFINKSSLVNEAVSEGLLSASVCVCVLAGSGSQCEKCN